MYAAHGDTPGHERYRSWLREALTGDEPLGISELVLSGVVRVITNRRVFQMPASPADALAFAEAIREHPNVTILRPGPRHWEIFARLCRDANARGNAVPDAYHAALAIESGCEWITTDRGFARFPGLRWRHPLAA